MLSASFMPVLRCETNSNPPGRKSGGIVFLACCLLSEPEVILSSGKLCALSFCNFCLLSIYRDVEETT